MMSGKNDQKKTKILYLITQSEFGGAQKYIYDLAVSLNGTYEIMVAYGEPGSNSLLTERLEKAGVKHRKLDNLVRDIRFIKDIKALFEIIGLLNDFRPDLMHLNSSKISILGTMAKVMMLGGNYRKPRIVYTVHGWVFNEPMDYLKKIFYIYAEKLFSYAKDRIICIDNFDLQLAKIILKIKGSKLSVINNGLDTGQIDLQEKKDAQNILLKKFPICSPDRRPEIFIGAIGHLYKTKGYEYLIEAMEIVAGRQKNFALFIIGEGEERPRLEKMIIEYDLENNIFLSGGIDHAADIMPAFDLYVCSSVKEGFPYVLLEAMYAGLPIVSTNVGGIPDMIRHNKNGLLVESKNPDQLAERILKLFANHDLRIKLGENAKKTVLEKFKLEHMIAKTVNVYESLDH
jgi:glycosyltransferase involved in cell wall biosynthesis